jgi:hemoglobin-like flavoprotein
MQTTATMTSGQVALIKQSFDAMWPVRDQLADLSYRRFFELAPEAQALFSPDMKRQQLKLMDMIAALVAALDQREQFQSLITNSGRQHAKLGVNSSQYSKFGEALIWSFERQFGCDFTPKLREAWAALYAVVQDEMVRSGAGQANLSDGEAARGTSIACSRTSGSATAKVIV